MKVILVVPNFRWKKSMENILWHYIPYGLCMLASVIESHFQVKIVDAYKENLSKEAFADIIKCEQPDVVGITVLMDYFGKTLHDAALICKQVCADIKVVAGGVYATTNIEKVLEDENIDFLIAGEGEQAFFDLLKSISEGDKINEDGIYYRKNGELVGNGRAKFIDDLDSLPFPAYHLIDLKRYIYDVSRHTVDAPRRLPYAEIFTSRGCPFRCCFCQSRHIIGQKFRGRSAENVVDEIDWMIRTYKIQSVIFMDDNFLTDRERAIKIMEAVGKRKLEWKMSATAVYFLDDELLEIMSRTGCSYIDVAIESGTYRVLHDVIHKPIQSFEQVVRAVRKAQSVGIYVAANFIVGFPTETWDEIRETIKFAEDLQADYIKLFNALPLPHTELYEECIKNNCLVPGYDSENIDWKSGMIETNEFSRNDLTILRAYEWDRINFSNPQKIKKTADMMGISVQELQLIRKNTRLAVAELIR